ncbi:MAG: peptidylprolyl isomerase [Pyrinomonadaceae bacterium]
MKKKLGILLFVTLVVAGVAGVWMVQNQRAKNAKIEAEILRGLTEEQLVMLLQNQQLVEPGKTLSVVETPESRNVFLKGLREYLALAARARHEGVSEEPNIQRVLEYRSDTLLYTLYRNKLDNDQGSYFELPKEQIEGFMNMPANAERHRADMEAFKAIQRTVAQNTGNPLPGASAGTGEAAAKARDEWAKSKIISGMAKEDLEFMEQPAIQLRLKVAEAGVLATNYINKHWAENIKVTDKEITNYLASHPEYDPQVKLDLARKVFERVKAGEDFNALAKEFSEDRTTKSSGGLYENVEAGFLWPEIEKVVGMLQNGQLADRLIETKDGFHIVKLDKKFLKRGDDGKERPMFNVRHIQIQKRFEEPGVRLPDIPPPFLTPNEIAEASLRKQKRQDFIDKIVASEVITLPEDFAYAITDELRNSGVRLENLLEKDRQGEAGK